MGLWSHGGRGCYPALLPIGRDRNMQQDILVNWSPQETRVAIVENGAVQELHVERTLERGLVGNVYLGKVSRVLPGMQSLLLWHGQAHLPTAVLQRCVIQAASFWQANAIGLGCDMPP